MTLETKSPNYRMEGVALSQILLNSVVGLGGNKITPTPNKNRTNYYFGVQICWQIK